MNSRRAMLAAAIGMAIAAKACADDNDRQPARRVDIYGDPLPEGALVRLGTVRHRAPTGAGQIEFLPDGQTLLACSQGRVVWIDVLTGRTVRSIDLGVDSASLLALSPDRLLAAVSTRDALSELQAGMWGVVIVDAANGDVRSRLEYRGGTVRAAIRAACFSPDGARLVTRDADGIVCTWSVADGRRDRERVWTLPSSAKVERIACSADGKWLAACSRGIAFRWEWRDDSEVRPFQQAPEEVVSLAFSPDGKTIALGADNREAVRLFDIETGRQVRRLESNGRRCYPDELAFTSDGSRLVAASHNSQTGANADLPGEMDVWNVNSGELLLGVPFAVGLRHVAVAPDDRWMAATTSGANVVVWDLDTGEQIGGEFFGHQRRITTLAVSQDGKRVLTAGDEGWAALWDAETGRPVQILRHRAGWWIRGMAFSPDGRLAATSALDNTVVVWNCDTGRRVYTLPGHGDTGGIRIVRFTPDGQQLLSFGDDFFLRVFDVRTGKAVLEHPIRPTGLPLRDSLDGSVDRDGDRDNFLETYVRGSFTPDGQSLVLAHWSAVYLIDVQTGTELARHDLDVGTDALSVALSTDGARLTMPRLTDRRSADGFREYSIDIRSLQTWELEQTIPVRGESRPRIDFSPDGAAVAVAVEDLRVYDIATGRELARIQPESPLIEGVTLTSDGHGLVSIHIDKTALIWDWRQFLIDEETAR